MRSVHGGHRDAAAARTPRAQARHGSRGAFTLVELAIAVSILLIGMVSVATATSRMHSLRRHNREHTLAQNAVRSIAERIQAQSFRLAENAPNTWAQDILALFSAGGEFGERFDIEGLRPVPGMPSVGTVTFVTDETVTDADLGFEVGMPRDLNGDSVIDAADVSDDARILPVLITARWRGVQGRDGTYRHALYVMGY